MKLTKCLSLVGIALLLVSACSATTEIASTEIDRDSAIAIEPTVAATAERAAAEVPIVEPTVIPEPTPGATPEPTPTTVPPTPTAEPTPAPTFAAIAEQDHSGLAGTRGLTLQWISWEPDDWGSIEFVPLVDGSYAVSGTQTGPNGDFVAVDGSVVQLSERELWFTGRVVVQLAFANEGEPCVRGGDITFLATGDRRFWRMQDLLNCDGVITDYVDIYFG